MGRLPDKTPEAPAGSATGGQSSPSMSQISPGMGPISKITPTAPTITPSLPVPTQTAPQPQPSTGSQPSTGGLAATIVNPGELPSQFSGQNTLRLVIQKEDAPPSLPSSGLGFLELFVALVAALLVAPYLHKAAGKWIGNLNAIEFVRKNGIVISTYLVVFTSGWILFMIVLPQLYMLDFSFRFNLSPADVGGPNDVYTLKNYRYLLFGPPGSDEFMNWLHLAVFFKTILASALVTLINFAMCYPLAYYMAQSARGGGQRLLFLCLLLPFWVNEILRAFAFKLIFADQGIINSIMVGIGLCDASFDFFKPDIALYTGLTYAYLLLMIFPLYNAIESLDHNQVEAARDLGSSWLRIHFRVVMPHAKPGIASGCTMVFMLAAGALAAPNILGGPSSLWFTQIIYQWYNTGGNWPQGSSYAFVLLIACIIFVRLIMRMFKVSLGEIAQR